MNYTININCIYLFIYSSTLLLLYFALIIFRSSFVSCPVYTTTPITYYVFLIIHPRNNKLLISNGIALIFEGSSLPKKWWSYADGYIYIRSITSLIISVLP